MRIRDVFAGFMLARLFAPRRRPAPTPYVVPPGTPVPGATSVGCMVYVAGGVLVAFVLLMVLLFGGYWWYWFANTIHEIVSLPSKIHW